MATLYAVAIMMLFSVNSPRDIEHTKDSLAVIKKNVVSGKAMLVDVRSEEEWKQGHLEGSIFVPVTSLHKDGDPKKLAKILPKDKISTRSVLLVCEPKPPLTNWVSMGTRFAPSNPDTMIF
jgi:hypothetical protein